MKPKILGLLAVGLLAGPAIADAAIITRTYNVVVSGLNNSGSPSPIPAFDLVIGVMFDPAVTVTGFNAVDSFTGATIFGPVGFQYSNVSREMILGDNCLASGDPNCSFTVSGGPDLIITLNLTDVDNPVLRFFTFRQGGGVSDTWQNYTTGQASVYGGSPSTVPEPGTLALLGLGLAGLGLNRRRKAT